MWGESIFPENVSAQGCLERGVEKSQDQLHNQRPAPVLYISNMNTELMKHVRPKKSMVP